MSGNNPLVSVLIPAYNHEKYIQETIKSIINQTYQNIELIIIDDGSKDSTWAKIQEMKAECEKRFARVHFETKENEGTTNTLNKLLDKSKGGYIYIIASDDIAKPQAIEHQLNFLKNAPEYALCVGDNEFIDSESKRYYWDSSRNGVYDEKEACYLTFSEYAQVSTKFKFTSEKFGSYETLYERNYIPNGYLIRKDIFKLTGYYTSEAPLEDYYLMLQISKYSKMKYLDEILFSYRCHNANTMNNAEIITKYEKETRSFEEKILKNTNEKLVAKNVLEIKKHGLIYKKQGIPFLFQIISYIRGNEKIRTIKLFNIKIYEYKKER